MKRQSFFQIYKDFINGLSYSCRFLVIIGTIALITTCISIFDNNLDASGNLVTIRTILSSIVGFILEKSTKVCNQDKLLLKNKVIIIGSVSVVSTIVVILSYLFSINVNNPSLTLVKNLLFSCVGFLISCSNED